MMRQHHAGCAAGEVHHVREAMAWGHLRNAAIHATISVDRHPQWIDGPRFDAATRRIPPASRSAPPHRARQMVLPHRLDHPADLGEDLARFRPR